MSEGIIPGERTLDMDEMRVIQDMHQAGRTAEDIAARIGGVDPIRIAALLAPKRPVARKVWKGRR